MKLFAKLSLSILLSFCSQIWAETIYFIDGHSSTGTIKEVRDDGVIMVTDYGELVIPKNKILKIDYASVGPNDLSGYIKTQQTTRTEIPLNERPGYWFVLSGVSLLLAANFSNEADRLDAENAKLNASPYSTTTLTNVNRTPIYVLFGIGAYSAFQGFTLLEKEKIKVSVMNGYGKTTLIAWKDF